MREKDQKVLPEFGIQGSKVGKQSEQGTSRGSGFKGEKQSDS